MIATYFLQTHEDACSSFNTCGFVILSNRSWEGAVSMSTYNEGRDAKIIDFHRKGQVQQGTIRREGFI